MKFKAIKWLLVIGNIRKEKSASQSHNWLGLAIKANVLLARAIHSKPFISQSKTYLLLGSREAQYKVSQNK